MNKKLLHLLLLLIPSFAFSQIEIVTGGSGNNYTITFPGNFTAYAAGQEITFRADRANTGSATLNISGIGPITIKNTAGTNLSANDILANQIVKVTYEVNCNCFQMITTGGNLGSGTTQWTTTGSDIYYNAGNVGIGTIAPSALTKLDVLSTNTTTNSSAVNLNHAGAIAGTGYTLRATKTGASTTNVAGYFTATGGTNNYAGIFENGNVGIGTTTPTAKLHVVGTTLHEGTLNFNANPDAYGNARGISGQFYTLTGTKASLSTILGNNVIAGAATSTIKGGHMTSDPGNFIRLNYINGITFHTNITSAADVLETTNQRMVIDNSGNVGIGATVPGSALDVKGTLRLSGSTSGYVGFAPAPAAGTATYTLPTAAPTVSGYVLSSTTAGTMSWLDPATLGASLRWDLIAAPTASLSLAHGANTTAFNFNSVNTGTAFTLSSTSLTTGNVLSLSSSNAATTGNVLNVSSNSTGVAASGLSQFTFTGAHKGNGLQVDDVTAVGTAVGVVANNLTTGNGLSVASSSIGLTTGKIADFTLTGNNAANTGSVLRSSVTGLASPATVAMFTNNGIGASLRVNDDGLDADASPFIIDAAGNVGIGTNAPAAKLDVEGDFKLGTGGTVMNYIKSGSNTQFVGVFGVKGIATYTINVAGANITDLVFVNIVDAPAGLMLYRASISLPNTLSVSLINDGAGNSFGGIVTTHYMVIK